jgi:hypothetical protein
MLYRIFTEDKTEAVDVVQEAMTVHDIDSYTLIHATGYWKGAAENSLIIEVECDMSTATFYKICNIAKQIKLELSQEAVLVQRIESESLII